MLVRVEVICRVVLVVMLMESLRSFFVVKWGRLIIISVSDMHIILYSIYTVDGINIL